MINLGLHILCDEPLYLPVKWQWCLTFMWLLSFSTFFYRWYIGLHLGKILIHFLLMAIFFFFSKLITSAACSLKGIQNFFIQSFPQQKLCLFSIISNVHIFYIEYPQKYVHLFLLLKISLDYYLDLQKLFVVIDLISYIG